MTKTFKKFLSGALACTMILSATIPAISAFAEDSGGKEVPGYTYTDLDVHVDAEVQGVQDPSLNGTRSDEI